MPKVEWTTISQALQDAFGAFESCVLHMDSAGRALCSCVEIAHCNLGSGFFASVRHEASQAAEQAAPRRPEAMQRYLSCENVRPDLCATLRATVQCLTLVRMEIQRK